MSDRRPSGGGSVLPTLSDLQGRAAQGVSWTLLATLLGLPLAIAANLVLARIMGPIEVGQLAVYGLTAAVIAQLVVGGATSATIQWGAEAHARGDQVGLEVLLQKLTGWQMLVQAPVTVVVALYLLRDASMLCQVSAIAAVFTSCWFHTAAVELTVANQTHKLAQLAVPVSLLQNTGMIAAAIVSGRAEWVWVVMLTSAAINMILCSVLREPTVRADLRRMRVPRHAPPGLARFAMITGATGLLLLLVSNRSEIFVISIAGSPADVGLYAVAFGVAAHLTAPVDALMGPLAPAAAAIFATDPARLAPAMWRALRFAALGVGALLAAIVPTLFAVFEAIYGDAFAGAAVPFLFLAATSCLVTAAGPVNAFLVATRRPQALLKAGAVALSANLVLGFALVPSLDVSGAVIANAFGAVVLVGALARESRRIGSLRTTLASQAPLLVGVVVLVVAVSLPSLLASAPTVRALLAFLIGCSLYATVIGCSRLRPTQQELAIIIASLPRIGVALARGRATLASRRFRWRG